MLELVKRLATSVAKLRDLTVLGLVFTVLFGIPAVYYTKQSVDVAACIYPEFGLQTSQIFARINCDYLGVQTHIICERDQIVCDAIAIIHFGSH